MRVQQPQIRSIPHWPACARLMRTPILQAAIGVVNGRSNVGAASGQGIVGASPGQCRDKARAASGGCWGIVGILLVDSQWLCLCLHNVCAYYAEVHKLLCQPCFLFKFALRKQRTELWPKFKKSTKINCKIFVGDALSLKVFKQVN